MHFRTKSLLIFPHIVCIRLINENRQTVCAVRIRGCHRIGRIKKRTKNLGRLDFSLILITWAKSEIQNWREDLLRGVRGVGLSFMLMRPKKAVEVRCGAATARRCSQWINVTARPSCAFFFRAAQVLFFTPSARKPALSIASKFSIANGCWCCWAHCGVIGCSAPAPALRLAAPLNLALNCSSPELYRSRLATPL